MIQMLLTSCKTEGTALIYNNSDGELAYEIVLRSPEGVADALDRVAAICEEQVNGVQNAR